MADFHNSMCSNQSFLWGCRSRPEVGHWEPLPAGSSTSRLTQGLNANVRRRGNSDSKFIPSQGPYPSAVWVWAWGQVLMPSSGLQEHWGKEAGRLAGQSCWILPLRIGTSFFN